VIHNPLIISHYDLDGVVSAICMKNALRKLGHDAPVTYQSYKKDDQLVDNLITEFTGQKKTIFFLDYRLGLPYIKQLLTEPEFVVIVVDHHEWEDHEVTECRDLEKTGRFRFRWDKSKCGAELTQEMTRAMGQYDPDLDFLVYCTRVYDLWLTDEPEFKDHSLALNEMFWELKPEGFIHQFDCGYFGHLSPICAEIWRKFDDTREEYMAKAMEGSMQYTFPTEKKVLIIGTPEPKFTNLFTIYHPEFHYFFVVKSYNKDNTVSVSIRIREGNMTVQDIVDLARKHVPEMIGGGHKNAGGVTIPASIEPGDFFEMIIDEMEQDGA